jgi:hypothetical protein
MTALKEYVAGAPSTRFSSNQALWAGIIFSFAFTALIWLVRPFMPQIEFLPDTGVAWYYWQLPEATFGSRASAWLGYLAHQFFIWGTIWYAQKNKLKYTSGLHPINVVALAGTAFFIVLHLLQTAIWYDGLAKDTSIYASQGSVVVLLVMVLIMENKRRGLFFGKGKSIGWLNESGRVLRQYHGYIFAWAIIFTFWYHPVESTSGHLIGFFYTFLLMLQGALMYTRVHVNKYWTILLELVVVIHGTLVAVMLGQEVWPMFLFGFLGVFVVTQMHGLGLALWQRWGFLLAYVGLVVLVYSQRGWEYLNEIVRIPAIDYVLVFVIAGIIWVGMKLVGWFNGVRLPKYTAVSGD